MKSHLYFIGLAGHAMRGLALAAREQGYTVSGLDEAAVPPGSDWLDAHNFDWNRTYQASQLDGVATIVISGGTAADHPALLDAGARQLPIVSFAEFLGDWCRDDRVISVAGTHGKTTTTSLITWLLEAAGRNPSFLIGIQPFNFPSSARLQASGLTVLEGDEYKASNLDDRSKVEYYHPDTLVLTSVEHDHPDVFPTEEAMHERFKRIIGRLPLNGLLIACADDVDVLKVAAGAPCQTVGYGLENGDYIARNVAFQPGGIEFDVETSEGILGKLAVPLYGRHNVLNGLAAIAAVVREGVTFDDIAKAATGFKGAYRRFNVLTPVDSAITVIDDYAHHPTEVATTLEAARLHFPGRRLVAIFRPHTFSRTYALQAAYREVFEAGANRMYITDIEGSREGGGNTNITSAQLVQGLDDRVVYEPDRAQLVQSIQADAIAGDVVICMTVSGYNAIANELAQLLADDKVA